MLLPPIALLVWIVIGIVSDATSKKPTPPPPTLTNYEYHQQEQQREKFLNERVRFFTECMKDGSRSFCEVQWASIRGHVFDSDPRNFIADAIDCSKLGQ